MVLNQLQIMLMKFFKLLIFKVKKLWAASKVVFTFYLLSHSVKNLPEFRQAAKIAKAKQFTNVGTHLCLFSPHRALASHLEAKWEEIISDSLRQVQEQSSGFGLIMELTRGKFLLPKDTLYLWSAPLFLARKKEYFSLISVDLSVHESSLLLVLAYLRELYF